VTVKGEEAHRCKRLDGPPAGGVSRAFSLGKYKPKINGDGQECPSHMDRQPAIE